MLYQCPKCSWTGEATSTTNHYAKEHVKIVQAPYACRICHYATGYPNRFERHLKHRQHEKKIAELGDDTHNIIREPARNFQYLFRLVRDSKKEEEKVKESDRKAKELEKEELKERKSDRKAKELEQEKLKKRESDRKAKELEQKKLKERERDGKAKELEREKLKERERARTAEELEKQKVMEEEEKERDSKRKQDQENNNESEAMEEEKEVKQPTQPTARRISVEEWKEGWKDRGIQETDDSKVTTEKRKRGEEDDERLVKRALFDDVRVVLEPLRDISSMLSSSHTPIQCHHHHQCPTPTSSLTINHHRRLIASPLTYQDQVSALPTSSAFPD